MKRVLSAVTSITLAVALLASCGSKPASSTGGTAASSTPAASTSAPAATGGEGKVTISFLNGFTGGDGSYMRKITDGFNQSQDKYFVEELQEKEHYTKFKTGSYDLVVMHGANLMTYQHDGMLADMTAIYEAAGLSLDDFHPAGQKIVVIDGAPYAVPLDIHPLTMFYNKALSPEAPATLDDLKALNATLQAQDPTKFALGVPSTGLVEFYALATAVQNDIDLAPEGYLNFANKDYAEALMVWNRMVYEYKISPPNLGLDGEFKTFIQAEDSGTSAQTAVALTGPWYYAAVSEKFGDDLGIAGIPTVGKKAGGYGNSHNISVSADVTDQEKLDGIAAFLAYMYQPEVLSNWADAGQAPLHLATIETIQANADKYPLPAATIKSFDTMQTAPQVYNYGEQIRYMNEVVFPKLVTTENLTVDELMVELEKATSLAKEIADEA